MQDSPNTALQGIEGYDMRGPFPRGQLVQFNGSSNSSLTNFYVKNDLNKSWTEDNINIGGSDNVHISNGVVDGNNSPSGVGVIFENSSYGVVSHVDAIHMGDGAFSDYGSHNTFDYVRSFDNHVTGYAGRKPPLSNGLIFALANDTTITNAAYQNPANPGNIVSGGGYTDGTFTGTFDAHEITGQTPMSGWLNTFSSWYPLVEGTPGADTLQGTLGADTFRGGLGDDTYVVNNVGDKVIEVPGEGTDTVLASVSFSLAGQDVENLTLTGSGAINGTGNGLANLIIGNGAANVLDGGAGADTLQGGLGNDTFGFSTALVTGSVDHIRDFSPSASGNDDTIQLAQSAFRSLATGPLAAAAFKDLGVKGAMVDASDRILYNSRTGVLSYDADGSGTASTAVPFATLDNKPVITASDFTVV
ncbi:calcium-binding protein [Methylobacterium nodulans]|uniref:calcium-binding protein n=1 Tax=Methylobacterium nodulans TaxID=114616 RepID=UPI00016186EB|nr:calcium-binding protein [Methylobacterium nodulans]